MTRNMDRKMLFCLLITIFMCSVIVFDHIPSIQSPPPKHIEIISPQTLPPIQVATNISSSGQGTLLNFKEWAWGTQTQT
ncbi:MAG: hypothetical protein ACTSQI_20940, partial [Candidatus Helarchaeota archaeon]